MTVVELGEWKNGEYDPTWKYYWWFDVPIKEFVTWLTDNNYTGRMHGSGIFLLGTGNIYTGMFERGLFHGKGVMKKEDGTAMDGDWLQGKPGGKMKIAYTNGDSYEGEMLIGNYHGQGKVS